MLLIALPSKDWRHRRGFLSKRQTDFQQAIRRVDISKSILNGQRWLLVGRTKQSSNLCPNTNAVFHLFRPHCPSWKLPDGSNDFLPGGIKEFFSPPKRRWNQFFFLQEPQVQPPSPQPAADHWSAKFKGPAGRLVICLVAGEKQGSLSEWRLQFQNDLIAPAHADHLAVSHVKRRPTGSSIDRLLAPITAGDQNWTRDKTQVVTRA